MTRQEGVLLAGLLSLPACQVCAGRPVCVWEGGGQEGGQQGVGLGVVGCVVRTMKRC
jgi:hypothetical protein